MRIVIDTNESDAQIVMNMCANMGLYHSVVPDNKNVTKITDSPENEPLKFTAKWRSTIGLGNHSSNQLRLFISYDGVMWRQWYYKTITLLANESVYIKGDNPFGLNEGRNPYTTFMIEGGVECRGNIMSLLGAYTQKLPNKECFTQLFKECTGLLTAPELPATTLTDSCYAHMFCGCTSLKTAPELPATTLGENCYYSMFEKCDSLTQTPALPSISLADYCYCRMFCGCNSLTTAPELPATVLPDGCYAYMFAGCQNLKSIPVLPAMKLGENSLCGMFGDMLSASIWRTLTSNLK